MTKPNKGDPVGEAFRAFERWRREHDPEGNMEDVVEQTIAYSEWADKNSIEKYLDAAQPLCSSNVTVTPETKP